MLEHALAYAARGWFVFPLAPRSKVPITPNGFKDATRSEQRIRDWWATHPEANVGIDCGRSGLTVVDVDPRNGGTLTAPAVKRLPKTAQVLTGSGGWHFYLAGPGPSAKLAEGIDLQSEGKYVVAPPSVHESGNPYKWLVELELAERPDGLVPERREIASEVPDRIAEGGRESALVSFAGTMRRRGATAEEILAALVVMNERCDPPLLPRDLERIARSVGRYAPEPEPQPKVEEKVDRPRILNVRAFAAGVGEYDHSLDYLGAFLRGGERTHVIGPIGQGKTTFIGEALRAALAGEPFLALKGDGLKGRGDLRACFVALEMPEQRLLKYLASARLLDRDDFDVWHEMKGLKIDEEKSHRLQLDAVFRDYDIVAIDPWYKLIAEEVSEGMKNVGRIISFFDAMKERHPRTALVLGFHANEPKQGERLSGLGVASGYKVFQRDVDTAITFQRLPGDGNRSHVTWVKTRSEDLPTMGTRWLVQWERGMGFRRIERAKPTDELLAVMSGDWQGKVELAEEWGKSQSFTLATLLRLHRERRVEKRPDPDSRGGRAFEFRPVNLAQTKLTD